MSIEPETTIDAKSALLNSQTPDAAQPDGGFFYNLLTSILNTFKSNSFLFNPQKDTDDKTAETQSCNKSNNSLPLFNASSNVLFQNNIPALPGLIKIQYSDHAGQDEANSATTNTIVLSPIDALSAAEPKSSQEKDGNVLSASGYTLHKKDGNFRLTTKNDRSGAFPFEIENDNSDFQDNFSVIKDFHTLKVYTTSKAANVEGEADAGLQKGPFMTPLESTTMTPDSKIQFLVGKDLIKSVSADESSLPSDKFTQGDQVTSREHEKGIPLNEVNMKPEGIFPSADNTTNPYGLKVSQRVTGSPGITSSNENRFVITQKDDTSLEISLEPEGIGKLDIRLILDKGMINARIDASEAIGKDLLEKNLNNILNTLTNEGINIGSFSVNLRDKRNELKDTEKDMKVFRTTKEISLPTVYGNSGMISIFV